MQQNNPSIEDKNRAICGFMGWEFKLESEDWYMAYFEGRRMWADNLYGVNKVLLEGFRYHEDWNKLMPVVQKIKDHKQSCILLPLNGVPDSVMPYIQAMQPMNRALIKADLQGVYEGAYQFVKWYKNKRSNNHENI